MPWRGWKKTYCALRKQEKPLRDAAADNDRKSRFPVPANCGSMYMREKGMASGRPQKRGKSRNRFISVGLTDGMPSAGRTGLPDREDGPAPSAFSSQTENAIAIPPERDAPLGAEELK